MTIMTQMTLHMLKAMLKRNLRLQGILWNTNPLYIVGSTPTVCRLVHNNMILLAEDKEG